MAPAPQFRNMTDRGQKKEKTALFPSETSKKTEAGYRPVQRVHPAMGPRQARCDRMLWTSWAKAGGRQSFGGTETNLCRAGCSASRLVM